MYWIATFGLMIVSFGFGYYCCGVKYKNILSKGERLDQILDGQDSKSKKGSDTYTKGDCKNCVFMRTIDKDGWVRCPHMSFNPEPRACGFFKRKGV